MLPAVLRSIVSVVAAQQRQLALLSHALISAIAQRAQSTPLPLPGSCRAQAAAPRAHAVAAAEPACVPASAVAVLAGLCAHHQTRVAAMLLSSAPLSLLALLQAAYRARLQQLCSALGEGYLCTKQQQHGNDLCSSGEPQPMDCTAEPGSDISAEGGFMREADTPAEPCCSRSSGDGGGDAAAPGAARGDDDCDVRALMGGTWCDELAGMADCMTQLGLGAASEEACSHVINE